MNLDYIIATLSFDNYRYDLSNVGDHIIHLYVTAQLLSFLRFWKKSCNVLLNNIFLVLMITAYTTFSRITEKILTTDLKSSHRRCSVEKVVLRNFTKFSGKHLHQSLSFNKVTGLRSMTSSGVFVVNFENFSYIFLVSLLLILIK